MNSGQVKDAYAEIIYSNDIFEETLGTERQLIHKKPPLGADRGTPIAYYAVISLINGGRLYKLMTKDEVREHAKKYSKQKNKESGELNNLWSEKASGEFDKMGLKTVIRQIAKYAPKSTELVRSIDRDGTITEKLNTDMIYSNKQMELQKDPFGTSLSPAIRQPDLSDWIDVKSEEINPISDTQEKGQED
jgi:recombination protein RecT